ncbi:hypothetical protein D3C81_1490120 [compost metagenome]
MKVTQTQIASRSITRRMIFCPRKAASAAVVEEKISLIRIRLRPLARSRMSRVRSRSSCSLPRRSPGRSCFSNRVNIRSKWNSSAWLPGTGQPMQARWWTWPNRRAKVVLPPWLGPETTSTRSLPDSSKSLHTSSLPLFTSLLASARSKVSRAEMALSPSRTLG